ncbi:Hypothetical_protein [Hexamita inflata]|uniref:Hypothetical_protein n=1 Tax=Hexamita inflata TaxID=28002 RepID=A0AA86P2N6_9EUKA|nr:Hypothetical protein HINF_LOCUS18103 [Hexamita inflata]
MQNNIRRQVIPKAVQQQIDTTILERVCDALQLRGNNLEAVRYFLQNRELIARNRSINWPALDETIGHTYQTKSYSYKRFMDVIVPNVLPRYPLEIQESVERFIHVKVQRAHNAIQHMNEVQTSNFVKELEQEVKQQFGLTGSDMYSYKRQVDKNRHTIRSAIMRFRNEMNE